MSLCDNCKYTCPLQTNKVLKCSGHEESESAVPVMIISLKDADGDRLFDVYFKLLAEVKKYGINESNCRFTWMEEET